MTAMVDARARVDALTSAWICEDVDIRPSGADYGQTRFDAADAEYWAFVPGEEQ